jgi:N-acetylmuramoyl-L-alanine amidase
MNRLAPILVLLLLLLPLTGTAQEVARLDLGASSLTQEKPHFWSDKELHLTLGITRAVPYRTYLVADPPRLIVDLKDVDLSGVKPADLFGADKARAIRWGRAQGGWSRVVVELDGPYRIASAGQRVAQPVPQIAIALSPVSAAEFDPRPSATAALRNLPMPAEQPEAKTKDRLRVALDPGHGGFDPGAEVAGETEANLVLEFARQLTAALDERGIDVVLTRSDDSFVRLEQRMTIARDADADLFISLHADALPAGQAAGATVYVWKPQEQGQAARQLTLRHEGDDLMAGIDLSGQDEALVSTLMDFVRTDTQPSSQNFARWLTSRMALRGIELHSHPVQGAAYSVLKSPDIPSVLLELGFLTDDRDRANLTDPMWRAGMAQLLADAVVGWARDEMTKSTLKRQ